MPSATPLPAEEHQSFSAPPDRTRGLTRCGDCATAYRLFRSLAPTRGNSHSRHADGVSPKKVEVTFERQADNVAKRCSIVVVGLNLPSSEEVTMSLNAVGTNDFTNMFIQWES